MTGTLRSETVEILRPQQKDWGPQDDTKRSTPTKVGSRERQLADLISIGPAMLRDFKLLGIRTVEQLARQEPRLMYEKLSRKVGQRQDPCVLDTFCAAVAQARNPRLPAEKCQWWYWSRKRKKSRQSTVES